MKERKILFAGFGLLKDPEAMHAILDEEVPFTNAGGAGYILGSKLHIVGEDTLPTRPISQLGGQSVKEIIKKSLGDSWIGYSLDANNYSPSYSTLVTQYQITPEQLQILEEWEVAPFWHIKAMVRSGNGEEALTLTTQLRAHNSIPSGQDYDPYLIGRDQTFEAIAKFREQL